MVGKQQDGAKKTRYVDCIKPEKSSAVVVDRPKDRAGWLLKVGGRQEISRVWRVEV